MPDLPTCYHESPLGRLRIVVDDDGALHEIHFTDPGEPSVDPALIQPESARTPCADVIQQLDEYFEGRRKRFEFPIVVEGSPFRRGVWQAIARIPYGETWSYTDLAREVGSYRAVRAVGTACGANPVPIVVPCHRVLRSDGSLGGYGGGLEKKRFLLGLEQETSLLDMKRR